MKNLVVEFGLSAKLTVSECTSEDFMNILSSVDKFIEQDTSVRKLEIESEKEQQLSKVKLVRGVVTVLNHVPKNNSDDSCDESSGEQAEESDETLPGTNADPVIDAGKIKVKQNIAKVEEDVETEKNKAVKIRPETASRTSKLFNGFERSKDSDDFKKMERYLLFTNCKKCKKVFGVITDYPYSQCQCGEEHIPEHENILKGDIKCNCGKHLNFFADGTAVTSIKCGQCKADIPVKIEDGKFVKA